MASPPWSRKRLPPIVGAVGFDGGSKPAIAFVIPPKPIEEAPGSNLCSYSAECWTYAKGGLKCGYTFGEDNLRYAHAVVTQFGQKTIEYDTGDCDNYHALIGTDAAHPLTYTYDVDNRIGETAPDCTSGCSLTNDHGETDDEAAHDHTLLSGTLGGCSGGPGITPTAGAGPFDDSGTPFFVLTSDEETPSQVFTLDVDAAPTHRQWSLDDVQVHANGDPDVLARHECVDGSSNPVGWTTTVSNTYDVLFSDEITTDELLAFVSGTLADDTHFTNHSSDASCLGCFNLTATELAATYWSSLVRLTNTGITPAILHWQVVTWAVDTGSEDPCAADTSTVLALDNGSTTLPPGGTVDIELYPDTSGPNVVMQVVNVSCESV